MALGDIGAVIDELEFDEFDCKDPSVIKINANIIAVAYTGVAYDGWLKTFAIDSDGLINPLLFDELEFNEDQAYRCSIGHTIGDHYAIAYQGAANRAWIYPVTIDADGVITEHLHGELPFSEGSGNHCSICKIRNGLLAISYSEAGTSGRVVTIAVSITGHIIDEILGELTFHDDSINATHLIHCAGDVHAVAYQGPGSAGWLKTFKIDGAGVISDEVIDELEFYVSQASSIRMCKISATIYGIVYSDYFGDGRLITVSIDADGFISDTVLSEWEFDPSAASGNDIIRIDDNLVAIGYRTPAGSGEIFSCAITLEGIITAAKHTPLNYETNSGQNRIIHMLKNLYAIAYQGPNGDGWAKILNIETPENARYTGYLLMVGVG